MKILIADDHELQRKVLGARLRRHGHTVIEASDGAEAIEVLKEQKVEALVSDILMPKVDGYELCLEIRKSPKFSRLPVVLYSAIYTSPDDEKAALASGADVFFRKPIVEDELLLSLDNLISRRRRRPRTRILSKKKTVLKEYSARLVDKLEETIAGLEAKKQQLEKSEERFRMLLNTVSAAVFIYQRDRILYANRWAQELTEFTLDELLQRKPGDVIHPKDRELAERRLFMGTAIADVSSRISVRMVAKDGRMHWLDFSASPIHYDGKKAVIGTAFDITERKEAEAHLRESEERYRGLVENSLGLICIHDTQGRLLTVNPAAAQSLGYRSDEMIGKNLKEFLAPSARGLFGEYLERISKTGMDNGNMRILTREGQERTWFYHNVRLQRPDQTEYVLGHALDVTDQRETDERLRKSEEQLRMIIDAEPECVKITTEDGIVHQMNPAGLAMLEASDESMVLGKSVYDVIAPEYHEKYRDLTASVFKEKPGLLEFEIIGIV